jgi:hypothetical protein
MRVGGAIERRSPRKGVLRRSRVEGCRCRGVAAHGLARVNGSVNAEGGGKDTYFAGSLAGAEEVIRVAV